MTANFSDGLHERGRSLEEEFFRRDDERLLQKLRAKQAAESARDAMAKATGATNPAVLDRLIALEIRPETATALLLVPLVEVAWADDTLDEKERAAILALSREKGFAPGSAELELLESWLKRRPEPKLLTAWTLMIQGLCQQLGADEIAKLKTALLERARGVAKASGGVLGLGNKVSAKEAAMLTKLEAAFVAAK